MATEPGRHAVDPAGLQRTNSDNSDVVLGPDIVFFEFIDTDTAPICLVAQSADQMNLELVPNLGVGTLPPQFSKKLNK